MNPHKRLAIARKTGTDPIKSEPKLTLPKVYALYNTRDNTIIISGPYPLCKWAQSDQRIKNPLLRTVIRVAT